MCEFSEGADDLEEHSSGGRGGVDRLLMMDQRRCMAGWW
jgi:hypothetical protein